MATIGCDRALVELAEAMAGGARPEKNKMVRSTSNGFQGRFMVEDGGSNWGEWELL